MDLSSFLYKMQTRQIRIKCSSAPVALGAEESQRDPESEPERLRESQREPKRARESQRELERVRESQLFVDSTVF